jgi:hypothetical protein
MPHRFAATALANENTWARHQHGQTIGQDDSAIQASGMMPVASNTCYRSKCLHFHFGSTHWILRSTSNCDRVWTGVRDVHRRVGAHICWTATNRQARDWERRRLFLKMGGTLPISALKRAAFGLYYGPWQCNREVAAAARLGLRRRKSHYALSAEVRWGENIADQELSDDIKRRTTRKS